MKKIITFMLLMVAVTAMAQRPQQGRREHGQRPSIEQFNQQKCQYVVRHLGLSAADSLRFVPIYQEQLKKKGDLMRRYAADRATMHALRQHQQVADTTLQRINRQQADWKVEDAKLEQAFLIQLEQVLSPAQIYNYVQVEQKFKNEMMGRYQQRNQHRGQNKPNHGPNKPK